MATMALPIREMSADVQFQAADAQKRFWAIMEAKTSKVHLGIIVWLQVRSLNRSMGRLIERQKILLKRLQQSQGQRFTPDLYEKVGCDLQRLAGQTDSLVEDTYEMPEQCLSVWREKLETISDLSAHIDNFGESFRIAA